MPMEEAKINYAAPANTFDGLIEQQLLDGNWTSIERLAVFFKDGVTEDADVRQAL